MMISVEEREYDDPDSEKKRSKKRLKGYQRQEDLKSMKDTMREINNQIEHEYRLGYDALPKASS